MKCSELIHEVTKLNIFERFSLSPLNYQKAFKEYYLYTCIMDFSKDACIVYHMNLNF